ncbi:MAG: peptidylprolyl isomerase [Acidobacteriota bacterium]|nr:peptidylprolyl isomerase [Acidobacteriota bacterium]
MRKLSLIACLVALAGCSKPAPEERAKDQKSPELYRVNIDSSKGPFVIEIHRDWAPLGADRFYTLVKSGFFDGARFFRVIPAFMVQFGISGNPATTKRWNGTEFADDPGRQSNTRGMVSFATRGPNTRTTQVFINFGNNARLDGQGFTPFGRVVSGMDVVDQLYSGYGESPDQTRIESEGASYTEKDFPRLDYIKTAKIGG